MYDGGRRGLPMYEVRWTMYDLGNSRAKGAGYAERQRRGRWRLTPPMYDVRRTMYDLEI